MEPKPLKNKRKKLNAINIYGYYFREENVRSAVEWLKVNGWSQ